MFNFLKVKSLLFSNKKIYSFTFLTSALDALVKKTFKKILVQYLTELKKST